MFLKAHSGLLHGTKPARGKGGLGRVFQRLLQRSSQEMVVAWSRVIGKVVRSLDSGYILKGEAKGVSGRSGCRM